MTASLRLHLCFEEVVALVEGSYTKLRYLIYQSGQWVGPATAATGVGYIVDFARNRENRGLPAAAGTCTDWKTAVCRFVGQKTVEAAESLTELVVLGVLCQVTAIL